MANLNLLNEILAEILVCACEVLDQGLCDEEGSRCGCPCRAFVTAGKPVWDLEACCSDGQLAVWVEDIYPFGNFPNRASDINLCSNPLAANVKVQLLRCWPAVVRDDGSAPTGPEIQAASNDIYRDLYLLTWGLVCCLKQHARQRKFVLNGSNIVGPDGGCVGAEISFTVELIDVP
jgi:hypothetical protein